MKNLNTLGRIARVAVSCAMFGATMWLFGYLAHSDLRYFGEVALVAAVVFLVLRVLYALAERGEYGEAFRAFMDRVFSVDYLFEIAEALGPSSSRPARQLGSLWLEDNGEAMPADIRAEMDRAFSTDEDSGASYGGLWGNGPDFNPATGLPMVGGSFDTGGNLYGTSSSMDSISSMDSSFSMDSMSSIDPW